jgi:hypothetical protein
MGTLTIRIITEGPGDLSTGRKLGPYRVDSQEGSAVTLYNLQVRNPHRPYIVHVSRCTPGHGMRERVKILCKSRLKISTCF